MHGCEELQCLLPLLLATKRTFTLMCCKRKGNERTNGRSTILNHSYCTLASLLFCCLKTAPKTETFLTSLGEKRCTSALLFFEAKKKSLTYLLLCDNFLSPSNQTFKISGVIYEATDHPLKKGIGNGLLRQNDNWSFDNWYLDNWSFDNWSFDSWSFATGLLATCIWTTGLLKLVF